MSYECGLNISDFGCAPTAGSWVNIKCGKFLDELSDNFLENDLM
jgi:hypothetical protein